MPKDHDFSKGKRGPVLASCGKTRITIMLDDDILAHFRERAEAGGHGYQTMINAALRAAIATGKTAAKPARPLTESSLRRVLREELAAAPRRNAR